MYRYRMIYKKVTYLVGVIHDHDSQVMTTFTPDMPRFSSMCWLFNKSVKSSTWQNLRQIISITAYDLSDLSKPLEGRKNVLNEYNIVKYVFLDQNFPKLILSETLFSLLSKSIELIRNFKPPPEAYVRPHEALLGCVAATFLHYFLTFITITRS